MNQNIKTSILKSFRTIPGVGSVIAQDLWNLGFRNISELRNQNPEELYAKLCHVQGQPVDRCMLYVLRCAVYFVSNEQHEPDLLKWWNWKDRK